MLSKFSQYCVAIVYLIPGTIALSIVWVLREKVRQPVEGANYTRLLFWLCLAEGVHNAYYFIASALRTFDTAAYEMMMLPLPWLFIQGIIAWVFLVFGIHFMRDKDVALGNIKPIMDSAIRFRDLSLTDPLTALNNRRTMESTIATESKRAARSGRPFCIMMFDVDRFKAYNDTHGHQKGDALLVLIANILRKILRSDIDIPFRYGGDEFLVVLPDTSIEDGQVVAERLRQSIASLPEAGISVSIGLLLVSSRCGETVRNIIADADAAMYRAKKDGGDRITPQAL